VKLCPIIRVSKIDARGFLLIDAQLTSQHVQKARGSRSTSHSFLIFSAHTTLHRKSKGLSIDIPFYPYTFYTCNTAYKNQEVPDRCPVLSLYFLHVQCHGILINDHCTFHTHSSLAYEKQGASIYISNINMVSSKVNLVQIYKLTKVYCSTQKE
jgi:hypothetical protein